MWVRRKRRQCEKATLLARRSGGDRENKGEERQKDLKRREDRIGGLEVVFSPFFYLNFELTNVIR